MNRNEHIAYLNEFKDYSKKIASSLEESQKFLREAGITTPTGRLRKTYTSKDTSVTMTLSTK